MYYITLYKALEMFLYVWRLVIIFITENAIEVSGMFRQVSPCKSAGKQTGKATGRRKRNGRQQSRKEAVQSAFQAPCYKGQKKEFKPKDVRHQQQPTQAASRVLKFVHYSFIHYSSTTFLSVPGVHWSCFMLVVLGWLPRDTQRCCNALFITKLRSLLVTFYNSYHTVQSSYNCPNLVFSKPDEVRKGKKAQHMQPLQLASLANTIIKQGFCCISLQVQQIPQHFKTAGETLLEFNLFFQSSLNHSHSASLGWLLP